MASPDRPGDGVFSGDPRLLGVIWACWCWRPVLLGGARSTLEGGVFRRCWLGAITAHASHLSQPACPLDKPLQLLSGCCSGGHLAVAQWSVGR